MKPIRLAIAIFSLVLGCSSLTYAQSSTTASASAIPVLPTPVPSLSKLNVSSTLAKMQTTAAEGNPDAPAPVQIVGQFLQLTSAQQPIFGELLQARQTAVTPLFQGIAQREQQIELLVESGGNPAQIGTLMLQIYALQQQIVQIQQEFLANLANLLDPDQQQRLAAVSLAAQLQPVVPAFEVLQLF
jgi:hypothetical protein